MYRKVTALLSSRDSRIRPSSFASTRERRSDSTKWNEAIDACLAATVRLPLGSENSARTLSGVGI
jgi:hypothetical protein